MKAVFISYDQAHQVNVQEALNASNARGYTLFPQTGGRGSKTGDPHLGSHAWPSMNSSVLTIVEDNQVEPLLERIKKLDEDNILLGIRAFVWNIEQVV